MPDNRLPRRTILLVCCGAMMTISFAMAGPAVCLPAIAADLGMDNAQKGFFLASPFWGLSIIILVTGPLADRWGFRPLLAGSALLQATGLAMTSLARGQGLAITGGFVLGLGTGMCDALLTPIVCAIYPEKRTRFTSLLHAFYPIGLMVTIVLILLTFRAAWPWRWTYLLLSGLALPAGAVGLFLPLPGQSHEGPERLTGRRLLRQGAFWGLCAAIFLGGVTEIGPTTWLPDFVVQAATGDPEQGGVGLLCFGATMAVGRLGASLLVHRVGARRMLLGGAALSAVSLVLAGLSGGTLAAIFWLTVLGLGVAGFWPLIMGCAGDRYPQAGASMFSLLAAAGNFGGVVGPVSIGLVSKGLGLSAAMALLAAAPLVILALTVKGGRLLFR